MASSTPAWAGQLQESLEQWSQGKTDLAGRGLQRVVAALQGPANSVWRALVLNQLALLSNQLGHFEYGHNQWQAAQQAWTDAGVEPGSSDLEATVRWYSQLLEHYGFQQAAQQILRQHKASRPPLLDPWAKPDEPPLLRQPSESGSQEWHRLVGVALQAGVDGKLQRALGSVDRARDLASALPEAPRSLLMTLIYNAEAVSCFLAGDYGLASEARAESLRLWQALVPSPAFWTHGAFQQYGDALRDAGLTSAADAFEARLRQQQCPLLDPWSDLESGMQVGQWQSSEFHLHQDWKPAIESAFQSLGRSQFQQAQKELAMLEQRMSSEEHRRNAGALLSQTQSIVAYAAGDYDNAQSFFRKAVEVWEALPPGGRQDPPYFSDYKGLLSLYGLENMAERLGEKLCDPFVFYRPEQQMQTLSSSGPGEQEEEGDPRQRWEDQLREAWQLARQGRWAKAQQRASHSEKVARLLGPNDLRIGYSLNSQALFAQASGDYSDAPAIYEEAVRCWKRGAHVPSARTAFSEFCVLLREADWEPVADELAAMWDQPVARSAFNPALLPLDSLARTGMAVMETAAAEEDDGNLFLPSIPSRTAEPKPRLWGRLFRFALLLALLVLVAGGLWWARGHFHFSGM